MRKESLLKPYQEVKLESPSYLKRFIAGIVLAGLAYFIHGVYVAVVLNA